MNKLRKIIIGLSVFLLLVFFALFQIFTQTRYLSKEEVGKIYQEIDKAKSLQDLERKYYFSIADILEKYNSSVLISGPLPLGTYVLPPELIVQEIEGAVVKTDEGETDFLKGLDLTFLNEDELELGKSFFKLFVQEYTKYPLEWMAFSTPPWIVLAKEVKAHEETVGGIHNGIIVYDVSSAIDDPEATRKLIHHELMHWIEYYTQTMEDPDWPEKENEYLYTYDLSTGEYPRDGFVTDYAQVNAHEDKAETYAYLMTADGNRKLNERVKTDKILEGKVNYLKWLISSHAPGINDSYYNNRILNSK